jgi:hypothetical protein
MEQMVKAGTGEGSQAQEAADANLSAITATPKSPLASSTMPVFLFPHHSLNTLERQSRLDKIMHENKIKKDLGHDSCCANYILLHKNRPRKPPPKNTICNNALAYPPRLWHSRRLLERHPRGKNH